MKEYLKQLKKEIKEEGLYDLSIILYNTEEEELFELWDGENYFQDVRRFKNYEEVVQFIKKYKTIKQLEKNIYQLKEEL